MTDMQRTARYHSLSIGDRVLDGNLALAPMAGATGTVFRSLCRAQGASLVCTELVSARGIRYDPDLKRSWRYLQIRPEEHPVAIQLFGYDPDDFSYAVSVLLDHPVLSQLFAVDINMGCPVTKVVRTGAGSALMRDPKRAEDVVRAAVRAAEQANVPVTVKIRSGWNAEQINAPEVARRAEAAGAAAVMVHARTAKQMYGGTADWDVVSSVKQAVNIPVLGNGDVQDGASAIALLEQTGADGVAVGRAALGNPWIFRRIRAALQGEPDPGEPSPAERAEAVRTEAKQRILLLGEETAMREMRKITLWYLRGLPHAAAFRRQAVAVKTAEALGHLLDDWMKQIT